MYIKQSDVLCAEMKYGDEEEDEVAGSSGDGGRGARGLFASLRCNDEK